MKDRSYVRCRRNDGFKTSMAIDEGPAVQFFPDEIRYEAKFSGNRSLTLDFEKLYGKKWTDGCDETSKNIFKEALKSAKKIRFLFDAWPIDYLGEYVEFKYRFVDRPN
jgi:hypothetical protein